MELDWTDELYAELFDTQIAIMAPAGPITTRALAVLDADFDVPNSKFIDDMTLGDYRRGVDAVFDTYRIR